MTIFFMRVDTLFTQRALKCKKKMCNTDDVIKCRKYATQMKSSYGREARNEQSNRRIVYGFTAAESKAQIGPVNMLIPPPPCPC